jgi:hypothetical protein
MTDFYTIGYSQLLSSLALIGGFLGSGSFFFMNRVWNAKYGPSLDQLVIGITNLIGLAACFGGFLIIVYFFSTSGSILVEYSRTLPPDNQILLNYSCSDKMNCSADIPNQLLISCKGNNCASQPTCPNITPLPIQTLKTAMCPPIIALPKF